MRHELYWQRYEDWPRPRDGQRFRLLTHRVAGGGKGSYGTVLWTSRDPMTNGNQTMPPRDFQVRFDGLTRVYRLGHWEMALVA